MKKLFTLALMCMMMFVGFAQDPGTLDETFGNAGVVKVNPCDDIDNNPLIHVQKDGKILVVSMSRKDGANYHIGVTRLNVDGSVDETYGTNGHSFFAYQVAYKNEPMGSFLSDDGQLYIAGHIFAEDVMNKSYILCVDQNGFANPDFGVNGYVLYDRDKTVFYDIVMDSEGYIYVGGTTFTGVYDQIIIQRYTKQGVLDTSWGNNGSKLIIENEASSYIESLMFVEDGKLLVGGYVYIGVDEGSSYKIYNKARLWKLNPDLTYDASFGNNGVVEIEYALSNLVLDLDMQSDGSYIVSGMNEMPHVSSLPRSESFVVRVTKDGVLDNSFGGSGSVNFDLLPTDGCVTALGYVTVAHDNQIFGSIYTYDYNTGSSSRVYVFNLNPDGSSNEDFGGTGLVPTPWNSLEVQTLGVCMQKDGKFLVSGFFYDGSIDFQLLLSRYHTSVAPIQEEKEGASEISLSVNVLSETSAEVTITPNEYTTSYFAGVLPKEQYLQYGQDFWVDYLYEYAMPNTEGGVFVYEDLEKNTEYCAMAFGFNALGEMGEVAVAEFKTEGGDGLKVLNEVQFTVYPNPASTMIYVETYNNESAHVSILDVTGRCVKRVELSENVSAINIEDVDNGVYFIMVQQGENSSVRKLVVK